MKPDLVRVLRSALLCVIVFADVVAIVCAPGCTCCASRATATR
ncbi:hypothetical protein [Paraburkholderia sp. BR14320]